MSSPIRRAPRRTRATRLTAVSLSLAALGAWSGPTMGETAVDAVAPASDAPCDGVLGHALRPLAGSDVSALCERFAGRVLLIVNTASKCAFTPQFEALEALYGRYAAAGLSVLGFPSDDFRQELSEEADVAEFCRLNYGVSFPMFQKVHVTGDAVTPLFRDLADAAGGAPTWNFTKYLVDREGRVLGRYGPSVQPLGDELLRDIEAAL